MHSCVRGTDKYEKMKQRRGEEATRCAKESGPLSRRHCAGADQEGQLNKRTNEKKKGKCPLERMREKAEAVSNGNKRRGEVVERMRDGEKCDGGCQRCSLETGEGELRFVGGV